VTATAFKIDAKILAVEFRAVPGFPRYLVSDDGKVWTTRRDGTKRELVGGLDKDGYRKIILCRPGLRKYVRVHCLILSVFVGDPQAGQVGAHNDGNKINNAVSNLRWTTQKDNILDKHRHGTRQIGDRSPGRVLSESQVAEIKIRLRNGERGADLAREFGVRQCTISAIKVGRNWGHLHPISSNEMIGGSA
jgi:hypothetical protein